jgi:hypothetical protein
MSNKNQRLNATITIGSVLEGSVKRNVGVLRSGLQKVGDSIKDVERRQKELDRQRNVLRRQGESVEHLDREYDKLERTLNDLRRAQERWNRAAADSRRVGSTFSKMTSDIGRNTRRVAFGAALAGGAVFGLAKSTATLGDDVAKTADKLGFSIEGLQEYRYAAERSGISTSKFDSSMTALTKRVGEAAQGFGSGKRALDQLGLSAEEMVKLSPEKQLEAIAERMKGIESPAERAAIAAGLFSREGVGMVNMLADGSKGLNQLREDARRTGYVLSEQAARDAEVFQDTLLDTQLTMKGLKNTVGAALLPVVTQSMRRIGDYLVANRADVKRWAKGFADGVERVLPLVSEVVSGIGQIGSVVWSVTESTAAMVGGWENFGIVIGTVLASRTIVRVAKFGAAVFSLGRSLFALARTTPLVVGGIRAIGAALLMNPIGIAVAGIAGAAYLIYRNWEHIAPWFRGIWRDVKSIFGGFGDFVAGVFTGDMDRAATGVQAVWKGTKGVLGGVLDGIGGLFSWSYNNLIKPVTDAMGITKHVEAAWKGASTVLGPIVGDIGGYFSGMGQIIDGVMTGDMQKAADGAELIWQSASSALGRIVRGIGSVFSWSYKNLIKPITDKLGITDAIERAWVSLQTSIETIMGGIGSVFDAAWTNVIEPVIDALSTTGGISTAWDEVKAALDPVLTWIGDKFQAVMKFIQPVINGLKWAQDKGAAAAAKIGSVFGLSNNGDAPGGENTNTTRRHPRHQVQTNALGGPFRPGWHLTGEMGPELKFENRSGYVANNRAMRQLADYADRVGSVVSRQTATKSRAGAILGRAARTNATRKNESHIETPLGAAATSRVQALFAAGGDGGAAPGVSGAPITQNITKTYNINAASADAREVVRLLKQEERRERGNGLFDRAPSTGPYGR